MSELERIRLFLSVEHVCGYLPGRASRNAFIDPDFPLTPARYGWLLEQGFRRSGVHVYRPYCQHCHACIPARIPVASFVPTRSQRRCLQRNADLSLRVLRQLEDEHFTLYRDYLLARHAGGGMDAHNREAFHTFLECAWGEVSYWEFRSATRLVALAVVDETPRGLSAVYTFFDPDETQRGLGTYAVLRQIEIARSRGLGHVYLGYWVPGSPKMDYKRHFHPLEVLMSGGWKVADSPHGGR
jgi:arginyl-tRNA--protein-N-Asp/Glu arginylyltransferase